MILSIETPSTSEPFIFVFSPITHVYMAYHLECPKPRQYLPWVCIRSIHRLQQQFCDTELEQEPQSRALSASISHQPSLDEDKVYMLVFQGWVTLLTQVPLLAAAVSIVARLYWIKLYSILVAEILILNWNSMATASLCAFFEDAHGFQEHHSPPPLSDLQQGERLGRNAVLLCRNGSWAIERYKMSGHHYPGTLCGLCKRSTLPKGIIP